MATMAGGTLNIDVLCRSLILLKEGHCEFVNHILNNICKRRQWWEERRIWTWFCSTDYHGIGWKQWTTRNIWWNTVCVCVYVGVGLSLTKGWVDYVSEEKGLDSLYLFALPSLEGSVCLHGPRWMATESTSNSAGKGEVEGTPCVTEGTTQDCRP